jgi:hypothetical protein
MRANIDAWLKTSADCTAATPVESLWGQLLQGLDLIDSGLQPMAGTDPDPEAEDAEREDLITTLLDLTLKALLPACQHYKETCRSHLATELAALEQRYQALDAHATTDPAADEVALHRMLVRLWFLQMLSVSLDGDVPVPHEDLLLYLERLRMQLKGDGATEDLLPQVERISLEALTARAATCVEQADELAHAERDDSEQRGRLARTLADNQRHCRRLYTLLLDTVTRCEAYPGHVHADAHGKDDGEAGPAPALVPALAPALIRARAALQALEQAQFQLVGQAIALVDAMPDEAEVEAWLATHSSAIIDFAEDTLSDIPDRRLEVQVPVLKAAYRRLHRYRSALLDPRRKGL